jgi:hypothetical protein
MKKIVLPAAFANNDERRNPASASQNRICATLYNRMQESYLRITAKENENLIDRILPVCNVGM